MIIFIHKCGLNRNRLCFTYNLSSHKSLGSDRKDNELFSFPLKWSGTGNNVTSMEREFAQSSIRIWFFSHSVHTSLTPLILQCLKYYSLLCKGYSKLRYINLDKRNSVLRSGFFSFCAPQVFYIFNHFYVLTT